MPFFLYLKASAEMFGRLVSLFLLFSFTLGHSMGEMESEEVVPARINGRNGRFWKRSENQPSFKISAFGKDFVLHLVPDDRFLAPSFKIQSIRKEAPLPEDDPGAETPERDLRSCFYSGSVNSNQESIVAVSLCNGIQGAFISDGDEYTIEPKERGKKKRQQGHLQPHLVKRRVVSEKQGAGDPDFDQSGDLEKPVETAKGIRDASRTMARKFAPRSKRFVSEARFVETLLVADPSMVHFYGKDLKDICGHQNCDTLGVADTGTMCDPSRSCSVIEDDGLQAAYTAAHELGHVFSMPHDDSKTCERLFGNLGRHHMMSSLFIHLNKTLPWSPCSAMYITDFFDNGHGDCLLDSPLNTLPLPTGLPGTALAYSLDRQCQQIFGEEYKHCPNTSDGDICSQLWCRVEGQALCHTKNGSLPWVDGTACGEQKLCMNGVCMDKEETVKPKPVIDGNWGVWGPWGECSRTCGGGVQFSYRECNDPEPENGGKYCEGQRAKYQSCNTHDCPKNNGKSFREEQCEKYNSYNFIDMSGNVIEWIPKYAGVSPRDRCKLFCRARGSSEFKVFESKVVDGTSCGPDTTSLCVQGQCVKAGCDQVIGSSKKYDKCGVCGGDGSTCRKISGSLNRSKYGYNDIVTIPAGATNIDIKQRSHRGVKHDGNYLALKAKDGKYLLNGDFSISTVEQDIPVSGAVLKYSGSSTSLERIQSYQQLLEPLTIQLLSISGEISPPRVKYTFFIPKDISFSKPKSNEKKYSPHVIKQMLAPQWILGEWSECSHSCGSGWQRRNVECRDVEGKASTDCNRLLKPEDIRPCADSPCPVWQAGPWSSCSRTCDEGVRKRSVLCIDYMGKTIESEKCDPSVKPQLVTDACLLQEC
nr:PREDICTED: A disintegrin and metalloproteinase with thrombospondin motifs 8 isoform X2 [Latimeria chalumnae]|eukprot:XP_005999977.1 PREDICTED: A disintegrin and metalloproteinase with thrombospondin motifs 8 isoform X2 [Latimeria chalumnae]